MIVVDSDVFVIDLRYPRDPKSKDNKAFIKELAQSGRGATTIFNLLEICGILSYNLNREQLHSLFHYFPKRYNLKILPEHSPRYLPRLPLPRIWKIIARKTALGDALILILLESYTDVKLIVSWNVKHLQDRIDVEVLTPTEALERGIL